jgi:hypothetical protein
LDSLVTRARSELKLQQASNGESSAQEGS